MTSDLFDPSDFEIEHDHLKKLSCQCLFIRVHTDSRAHDLFDLANIESQNGHPEIERYLARSKVSLWT